MGEGVVSRSCIPSPDSHTATQTPDVPGRQSRSAVAACNAFTLASSAAKSVDYYGTQGMAAAVAPLTVPQLQAARRLIRRQRCCCHADPRCVIATLILPAASGI